MIGTPGVGWALLTGEYPPKIGGVASYTRNLAVALAASGDRVEVWAPPSPAGELARDAGVTVHTLPDHLGPRSLAVLDRALGRGRPDVRLLVQYVPHALGLRAMNVPLCVWLAARGRPFWAMFHELAFPILPGAPLRQNVLGVVNRAMVSLVARTADASFVSTSSWRPLLRRLAPSAPEAVWLPIPSSLPEQVDPSAVAKARAELGIAPGRVVIGSLGSYAQGAAEVLEVALPGLLAGDPRRVVLLLGKGSRELAGRIPGGANERRVIATGEQEVDRLAACLACADIVVQPYPDGVSTRRTTTMGSLALGVPVVTNKGRFTEAVWAREGAVALAEGASPAALVGTAEGVLAEDRRRRELGAAGRELYRRAFSVGCTVGTLRGYRGGAGSGSRNAGASDGASPGAELERPQG